MKVSAIRVPIEDSELLIFEADFSTSGSPGTRRAAVVRAFADWIEKNAERDFKIKDFGMRYLSVLVGEFCPREEQWGTWQDGEFVPKVAEVSEETVQPVANTA